MLLYPVLDSTDKDRVDKAAIVPLKTEYNGGASRGIAIVGSEQVFMKEYQCETRLKPSVVIVVDLDLINECSTLFRAREKIEISGIESSAIVNTGKAPNPNIQTIYLLKLVMKVHRK